MSAKAIMTPQKTLRDIFICLAISGGMNENDKDLEEDFKDVILTSLNKFILRLWFSMNLNNFLVQNWKRI